MPVIVRKRLLNVKEAADYLSIARTMLYHLVAKGQIRGLRIASRRLFDVNDLDDFVDRIKSEKS